MDTSGYETPPGATHPSRGASPSLRALPCLSGRWEASTSPASEALQTGGGAQDGWGERGRVQDGAGLTRALRLMQGEARGGGPTAAEVRQGEVTVCARSQASSGASARRGGEGKAGPGAREESGGSAPRQDPQRSSGAGGGDGGGWVGRAQSGTSGCAGSPLSPRR